MVVLVNRGIEMSTVVIIITSLSGINYIIYICHMFENIERQA